ncbi:MAG: hypothetical protein IT328_12985 [Caldilineaceae bacterium]|nr:hypothetical protein [Caldilineaceae bacterium]
MSTPITVQIPEEALIEALQQLSPERRRQILQQVDKKQRPQVVTIPADALLELKGIISVGGDALVESEHIYDE